eukprot:m.246894 g.246894  ORF g.246894 m.246894 type:complete len:72 (-) comp17154_c2_seq3:752-967(-)
MDSMLYLQQTTTKQTQDNTPLVKGWLNIGVLKHQLSLWWLLVLLLLLLLEQSCPSWHGRRAKRLGCRRLIW